MNNVSIIRSLILSGSCISINNGRLEVVPGQDVLTADLAEQIYVELADGFQIPVLQYEDYNAGPYGSHKAGGVVIQLFDHHKSEDACVFFNADVTRKRSSKNGNAGGRLPGKKFSVGKRSHFYKFWRRTGLKVPPSLSSFYDYMGNLKKLLFTGNYTKGNRLDAGSLKPLDISYDQILAVFTPRELAYNNRIESKQNPDNCQIPIPHNEFHQSQISSGFEENPTACKSAYDTSKQVDTVISDTVPILHTLSPADQIVDEWLADYDSVSY